MLWVKHVHFTFRQAHSLTVPTLDIPYESLPEEILQAVIEQFVLREGTDYGESEYSLDQKVAQVRLALKKGEAVVCFNPEDESCSIRLR